MVLFLIYRGYNITDLIYRIEELPMYEIKLPREVVYIIDALYDKGFNAHIVGGCVRDSILGLKPKDWDITTDAKPEDIKNIFKRTVDTGIKHGTVTVLIGKNSYEITTYRIDGSYTDGRHPDRVEFTADLIEDLKRRDFTINAMAYSDRSGLVDEFNGIGDIRLSCIRCVGRAEDRFLEDALRILRAIRFGAQLGFEIEENTYKAISELAFNLKNISKERIFVEINKILCSKDPSHIKKLIDTKINAYISDSFYKIDYSDCKDMENTAGLKEEKYIRWAALLRNKNAEYAQALLKELKSDNDCIDKVKKLVEFIKYELPKDKVGVRRFLSALGSELFDDLIELKKSGFLELSQGQEDFELCSVLKEEVLFNKDAYSLSELAVNGKDLIEYGMRPGREIGNILNMLLDKVIEAPELNEKSKLLKIIENI